MLPTRYFSFHKAKNWHSLVKNEIILSIPPHYYNLSKINIEAKVGYNHSWGWSKMVTTRKSLIGSTSQRYRPSEEAETSFKKWRVLDTYLYKKMTSEWLLVNESSVVILTTLKLGHHILIAPNVLLESQSSDQSKNDFNWENRSDLS